MEQEESVKQICARACCESEHQINFCQNEVIHHQVWAWWANRDECCLS